MVEWCKGLKIDYRAKMIITWNIMYVSLNELSSEGKLLVQYESLVSNDEKITDVILYLKQRYLVVASTEGLIYVYKYKITHK